jgi:hypothetical protein
VAILKPATDMLPTDFEAFLDREKESELAPIDDTARELRPSGLVGLALSGGGVPVGDRI